MTVQHQLRAALVSFFVDNVPMKLLALGSAVAIWAWVQSEHVVTRRVRVGVQYTFPDNLVRVDEVPLRLVATLEGPQSVLLPLDPQTLNIDIDLSAGLEGNNEIDFAIQPLKGLPPSLVLRQMSPPAADIWLEEPMEKEVPVSLSSINQPPRGFELRGFTLDPPTVLVYGPKSQIQNISQAPTDVIDLSGIIEDTTLDVPLTHSSTISSRWEHPITVNIDIAEIISDRVFADVQIAVRGSEWTTSTEQVNVTLHGPIRLLETINHEDLSVLARIPDDIPEDQMELELLHTTNNPSQWLSFVGFDTDTLSVNSVEPERIVLRRVPTEE